jgi:hypothetical protein
VFCKYDIIYTNIVAIQQFAWAPSKKECCLMMMGDDGLRNTNNEDLNLKKESEDSEEDSLPNFVDDVSNMVAGVNVTNSSRNCSSSGKRKAIQ